MGMFTFTLFSALIFSAPVHAESIPECFNFSVKVVQPLKPFPTPANPAVDEAVSEKHGGDQPSDWARVGGTAPQSIPVLVKALEDPHTIRNGDNTHVTARILKTAPDYKLIEQSIEVKPAFFLTLNWTEQWGYAALDGTLENAKAVLISYEKKTGTSHLRQLCGNTYLKALPNGGTWVQMYQAMSADQRDDQDILDDLKGTLATLRKLPMPKAPARVGTGRTSADGGVSTGRKSAAGH